MWVTPFKSFSVHLLSHEPKGSQGKQVARLTKFLEEASGICVHKKNYVEVKASRCYQFLSLKKRMP